MSDWTVGQRVYLRDVNENRRRDPAFIPPVVEIVKVGRTLVHAVYCGQTLAFGKNDGVRRDNYRHSRLQTFEQFAAENAATAALGRLTDHGIEFSHRRRVRLTAEQMNALADLLDTFADGADQ